MKTELSEGLNRKPVALDHRVTVKPELWLQNATGAGVVDSVLEQVPVPAAAQPDQPARATA